MKTEILTDSTRVCTITSPSPLVESIPKPSQELIALLDEWLEKGTYPKNVYETREFVPNETTRNLIAVSNAPGLPRFFVINGGRFRKQGQSFTELPISLPVSEMPYLPGGNLVIQSAVISANGEVTFVNDQSPRGGYYSDSLREKVLNTQRAYNKVKKLNRSRNGSTNLIIPEYIAAFEYSIDNRPTRFATGVYTINGGKVIDYYEGIELYGWDSCLATTYRAIGELAAIGECHPQLHFGNRYIIAQNRMTSFKIALTDFEDTVDISRFTRGSKFTGTADLLDFENDSSVLASPYAKGLILTLQHALKKDFSVFIKRFKCARFPADTTDVRNLIDQLHQQINSAANHFVRGYLGKDDIHYAVNLQNFTHKVEDEDAKNALYVLAESAMCGIETKNKQTEDAKYATEIATRRLAFLVAQEIVYSLMPKEFRLATDADAPAQEKNKRHRHKSKRT